MAVRGVDGCLDQRSQEYLQGEKENQQFLVNHVKDVTSLMDDQNREVERLNAVPSPLPLFGAATAFGTSRRLRNRIARRKAPPVASAID